MNMHHATRHSGFSLIELLMVIAVIAILAAVAMSVLPYMRDRAQGAKTITAFGQLEKAFHLSFQEWPTEDELGLGENPSLQAIALTGVFNDTLEGIPASFLEGFYYDNDGDFNAVHENCAVSDDGAGVNLVVDAGNIYTSTMVNEIDYLSDDGDGLLCGKVRLVGPYVLYLMQPDPSRFP